MSESARGVQGEQHDPAPMQHAHVPQDDVENEHQGEAHIHDHPVSPGESR